MSGSGSGSGSGEASYLNTAETLWGLNVPPLFIYSLFAVGKDFLLNSNLALASVKGLGALQRVGGQFYLKGNGVLMDLAGLRALRSVGSVALANNGNTQVWGSDEGLQCTDCKCSTDNYY